MTDHYWNGRYVPTRVGYDCAAFVRYRLPYGADQSKRIENMPSSQWGTLFSTERAESVAYQEQLHRLFIQRQEMARKARQREKLK